MSYVLFCSIHPGTGDTQCSVYIKHKKKLIKKQIIEFVKMIMTIEFRLKCHGFNR